LCRKDGAVWWYAASVAVQQGFGFGFCFRSAASVRIVLVMTCATNKLVQVLLLCA
jgi:hypothetical protein